MALLIWWLRDKESACKAINCLQWVRKIPWRSKRQPATMDRGAWRATVYGITRIGQNLAMKPPPQNLTSKRRFQREKLHIIQELSKMECLSPWTTITTTKKETVFSNRLNAVMIKISKEIDIPENKVKTQRPQKT